MKNLTPIIIILISIALFFIIIDPKYNEVQDLQDEISENEETLQLAKQLREKRELLRERYNQISEGERFELQKMLPDTVDNVRLIIDINNIAQKYGILIQDIRIASDEDSDSDVTVAGSEFEGIIEDTSIQYPDTSRIGVISFSFAVQAQYEVFLDFLKDLEEALRIVDIRSIQIDGEDESIFYNYRINLDTYWLK
jgi:Tfp pilus assembly protein PilO